MNRLVLPSLILALFAPACRTPAELAPQAAIQMPTRSADEEGKRLDALLEENFEASLPLNPILATFIQDPRYNYLAPNFLSPASRVAEGAFRRWWLHRIRTEIHGEGLEGQARLSYDVFVAQQEEDILGERFPDHLLPISQFSGLHSYVAQFGSGQSAQPFATVKDYDDWLVRLNAMVVIFDQAIINMREGMEKKIVQPRVVMEKALPQIAAHVVDDPEKSIFWMPIENLPEVFSAADKARLTREYRRAITEVVVPSYRRLHTFVKDEYLPKTRSTVGYWDLPDGPAWYAYRVRRMTTTDETPEAIHALGLAEVKRIHDEMREVMKQMGFKGDLAAWFKHVQEDPSFYFKDPEALLQGYRDLQTKVNARLPKLFDVFPKADYRVMAVEAFRNQSAAGASYEPASPDGSRPGIFYVNTYDLKGQPKFGMETLSLHEASPGHHFQISIQQELESLPKFRRFGGYTAFDEGWALYAESIGKELGMFEDPMQYYGKLSDEMLRAMRLVVDTGLHSKKWTREHAIDFMRKSSSMGSADIEAEVERYIAIPGQALAYKLGQIAIWKLRKKAQAELGDAFDIKAFHREILNDGALPLDVLSAKVDRYLERAKAAAAQGT